MGMRQHSKSCLTRRYLSEFRRCHGQGHFVGGITQGTAIQAVVTLESDKTDIGPRLSAMGQQPLGQVRCEMYGHPLPAALGRAAGSG